jgi:hypothetical protein
MQAITRLIVAALVLMLLPAAACGGEAASGSTSSPPASRQAAAAATSAYLRARTQALVAGSPARAVRRACTPDSGLADSVLWWAAGTRTSRRGREIGVPPKGYSSAGVEVVVRRVTVDEAANEATVLAYTAPSPGDARNVDSVPAFHLVKLVRAAGGTWLAAGDTSTAYDPDLPVFLEAGGAPPAVVAAARVEVRRAQHPGSPPAGSLKPLLAWCAAMNARDGAALKATYAPDSGVQSMTDGQVAAAFAEGSPPNRREWRIVRMNLLGTQLDGVACGWVDYRYLSDESARIPGSRGAATFAFLERQPDGGWLIYDPPE